MLQCTSGMRNSCVGLTRIGRDGCKRRKVGHPRTYGPCVAWMHLGALRACSPRGDETPPSASQRVRSSTSDAFAQPLEFSTRPPLMSPVNERRTGYGPGSGNHFRLTRPLPTHLRTKLCSLPVSSRSAPSSPPARCPSARSSRCAVASTSARSPRPTSTAS